MNILKNILSYSAIARCLLLCLAFVSVAAYAQTTVLSESFYFKTSEESWVAPEKGGWTLDNCWVKKNEEYMHIGSGSSPSYKSGSVTTPALGVNGNVALFIETARFQSIIATFTVSVEGDGSIASLDYTVGGDDPYRHSAIYIIGCKPTTKIKIESTYGKFYLKTIKVKTINDAFFYESFSNLTSGSEFVDADAATEAMCDNYTGVSFAGEMKQAKGNIFFNKTSTYTLPTVSFEGSKDMLLTFRVGSRASGSYVGLSTSDDTQMTDFDSTDRLTLYASRQLTLEGTLRTWQNHSIIIKDMTSSTVLTISGKNIHLDDVMLRPIPSGLSQSQDNSAFIESNSGQTMDVNVTRTLTKDKWCPLCLPFDVTPSLLATAASTSCEVRRPGSVTDGIFSLDKVESDETISAGTPFLVKPAATVSTLSFTSVTISDAAASSDSFNGGDYQFVGCYSPVFLNTDGTNLFLGTDGNLYKPGTDIGYNLLGGLRAYFVVPAGEESSRVFFSDDVYTVINDLRITPDESAVYDLQGRNITSRQLRPGLYISQGRKYVVR